MSVCKYVSSSRINELILHCLSCVHYHTLLWDWRLTHRPHQQPTTHPSPVPLHWQDEVKAGLNRDVRLGVLEPVPIGEPVTWYHRKVICAKKKGSLRRTNDFQPLNLHATRETHHTQSPFHQARAVPQGKKKLSLMLGTATTVSHSNAMTDTSRKTALL